MNRIKRAKSLNCYRLNSSTVKIVDDALKIIGYRFNLLDHMRNGSDVMGKDKTRRCVQVHTRVEKDMKIAKEKSQ